MLVDALGCAHPQVAGRRKAAAATRGATAMHRTDTAHTSPFAVRLSSANTGADGTAILNRDAASANSRAVHLPRRTTRVTASAGPNVEAMSIVGATRLRPPLSDGPTRLRSRIGDTSVTAAADPSAHPSSNLLDSASCALGSAGPSVPGVRHRVITSFRPVLLPRLFAHALALAASTGKSRASRLLTFALLVRPFVAAALQLTEFTIITTSTSAATAAFLAVHLSTKVSVGTEVPSALDTSALGALG